MRRMTLIVAVGLSDVARSLVSTHRCGMARRMARLSPARLVGRLIPCLSLPVRLLGRLIPCLSLPAHLPGRPIPCLSLFVCLSLVGCLVGCASSNDFVEPKETMPHAVLRFEAPDMGLAKSLNALNAFAVEINGAAPNQWQWSVRSFRVSPGPVVILVCVPTANGFVASGFVEFEAEIGEDYFISAEEQGESVVVLAHDASSQLVANADTALQIVPTRVSFQTIRPYKSEEP